MGFGTILKLRQYLSRQNLELLDTVLRGLTAPRESEAFPHFWAWAAKTGMSTAQIEHAVRSLGELRRILRDYLAEGE